MQDQVGRAGARGDVTRFNHLDRIDQLIHGRRGTEITVVWNKGKQKVSFSFDAILTHQEIDCDFG